MTDRGMSFQLAAKKVMTQAQKRSAEDGKTDHQRLTPAGGLEADGILGVSGKNRLRLFRGDRTVPFPLHHFPAEVRGEFAAEVSEIHHLWGSRIQRNNDGANIAIGLDSAGISAGQFHRLQVSRR